MEALNATNPFDKYIGETITLYVGNKYVGKIYVNDPAELQEPELRIKFDG